MSREKNKHIIYETCTKTTINNQIEDAITDLIDDDPDLTLDEIVADLVDELRRWYPNWSGGSKSECKNDGKYPSYSNYLCKYFHL